MTDVKDTTAALANLNVGDSEAIDTHAKHDGSNVLLPAPGATHPSLPAAYSKVLTVDIGGRKFRVSRGILEAESGLFRHQLSKRFTWEPDEGGSYFLYADPNSLSIFFGSCAALKCFHSSTTTLRGSITTFTTDCRLRQSTFKLMRCMSGSRPRYETAHLSRVMKTLTQRRSTLKP
jgi:hypothetical protein